MFKLPFVLEGDRIRRFQHRGNITTMSRSAQSAPVIPRLEHSPRARRYAFWIGLATVILFACSFIQFAFLDSMAKPASERVNNGRRATFFAVHVNPYYTVSEDFHLYAVRSKRIMDRGWTDSLLYRRDEAQANYAAPLQVALMMIAVATDGRPLPYSLFICGVLSLAWGVFYVAATRWLPPTVSPISPIIATVVTMMFESIGVLNSPRSDFGQWPPHRGSRMATIGWSAPLTMAVILAATSLLVRRERPGPRLAFVAIVLCVLAAADPWSLMLALACIAVLIVVLTVMTVFRPRRYGGRRPLLVIGIGLGLSSLIALSIQLLTGGLSGDVLTRAGFGPAWVDSPISVQANNELWRVVRHDLRTLVILAIGSGVYITLRRSRAHGSLKCRLLLNWPTRTRRHFWLLVMTPTAAIALLTVAFARYGMEGYHMHQFFWRREYLELFVYSVFCIEVVKRLIRSAAVDRRRSRVLEIGGAVALLAALFAYHNDRIHKYITRQAAYEFFLTEDEEHLGDWLKRLDMRRDQFALATASHELNYLCAYWTDADLLLPEGFPYHSAASFDEIAARMARLLAVYRSTPQRWASFNLHQHSSDQWNWAKSRLLSARSGYLYYLMHRGLLVEGTVGKSGESSIGSATVRIAHRVEVDRKNVIEMLFEQAPRGFELVDSVAEKLRKRPAVEAQERPDVIIIDEVSRALGTPDLDGYTREFHHGDIEAWVLK